MEGVVYEATLNDATLEGVNKHLIQKLDELILAVDPKTDPELLKVITESVAKLNTSVKGNNIFTPQETPEERQAREQKEVLEGVLKGE